ncbi:MAG: hypothetical protein ACIAQZ_01900 [Sedimentisphaeraceae bacterium JB056]
MFLKVSTADISSNFTYAGNEKTVAVDSVTGYQLNYLTNNQYMNTSCYPHNRGWSNDGNYIFIESDRPRPDGQPSTGNTVGDYHFIERQLLAVNVNNGDIYWLGSIEVEDISQYGVNHVSMSSQYHIDYSPGADILVYYDMTGHRLYTLDLDTGNRNLIWHSEYATLGDTPSISWDGRAVLVYACSAKPTDSSFFSGKTTSIYKIRLNTETGEAIGLPKLVYSYSNRSDISQDSEINIGHVIIDPMDVSQMTFCHGYSGSADGSVQKRRVWYGKTDGSLIKSLTDTQNIDTHEMWGFSNRYSYFVRIKSSGSSIQKLDVLNGGLEEVFSSTSLAIIHIGLDKAENLFVFDTFNSLIDDYTRNIGIWLYNRAEASLIQVASQIGGVNHPRHPHPILRPDGKMIAFNVGVGIDDSQVVVVDIDQ